MGEELSNEELDEQLRKLWTKDSALRELLGAVHEEIDRLQLIKKEREREAKDARRKAREDARVERRVAEELLKRERAAEASKPKSPKKP